MEELAEVRDRQKRSTPRDSTEKNGTVSARSQGFRPSAAGFACFHQLQLANRLPAVVALETRFFLPTSRDYNRTTPRGSSSSPLSEPPLLFNTSSAPIEGPTPDHSMSSGLPGAIAGPGLGAHEVVADRTQREEPIHEKTGVESASASTLNEDDDVRRPHEGVNVTKAENEFAVSPATGLSPPIQ